MVTIVLTIQSIFRKNGHSDIVVTSGIGIGTFIAGLSCLTYIVVRFIIRWKLLTNGCEHPNDNFLDVVRIVAVVAGCHFISTLLFGIWKIIPRNDSYFKDNNSNNGKSLSVWALSNHVNIGNNTNDRTLQYCHV
ncbi:hypothetical protein CHS0354_040435 [Potamilus streckersoni]|uniref:Uncharacterized protein n=1 Tax=Potamilus streckersoni TaxID=2493646 RepID=A0AAE0T096_9BIVA|nr:hypothetical protein CHS0354_040435 [Potamilus streckersoni]